MIKKYTENNCTIAIWEIKETINKKNSTTNNLEFADIKTEKRKKEYLASRFLLQLIDPEAKISYNSFGAPQLDNKQFISISHSKNIVAIIVSKYKVGLDVENITEKPLKLASKFISKNKWKSISKEKATLIWCCKEAIFKWHQKGGVDFKKDISINAFKLKNNGSIIAKFKRKKYTLHYKKIDTHFLVYVCK